MKNTLLIAGALTASLISFGTLAQDSKGVSDTHPQYQGVEEKRAYKEIYKEQYKKKNSFSKKDSDAMYKQMHRHIPESLDKFKDFRDYGKKKKHRGKGKPDISEMSKDERKAYRAEWRKKKMIHADRKASTSHKNKERNFAYPEIDNYFQNLKKSEGKLESRSFKETRKDRWKRFKEMSLDERKEAYSEWKKNKESWSDK